MATDAGGAAAYDRPLAGRVALVTGGSRGIGRAVAERLARAGALIAFSYRAEEAAARAAAEAVHAANPSVDHLVLHLDLADPDAARRGVDDVLARAGRIDVLVNNAGVYVEHRVEDATYAEWNDAWRRTLGVNLVGAANVTYCVARHMIERGGGGRIVNVSSRGAFRGEPDFPAYGASKAGLNAFGQSMAVALGRHGIVVATVAPGFVETDMAERFLAGPEGDAIRAQSPLARAARPEEIAEAVLFFASADVEAATGAILDLNGASYLRT